MHRCLPLLKKGKKLVFLCFTIVEPQDPTWPFLLDVVDNPNAECNSRFKQEL
jgi:hypothetical protein